MNRILVADTLRQGCFPEAGRVLYEEILSRENSIDKIVIDFEGVSSVPSLYLNTSFGMLVVEKGVEFVKSKLSFANITKSQADRIKKYVDCIR